MALNTGYAAYANNKVMTASPAELTLMLYDGSSAILRFAQSKRAMWKKHITIS